VLTSLTRGQECRDNAADVTGKWQQGEAMKKRSKRGSSSGWNSNIGDIGEADVIALLDPMLKLRFICGGFRQRRGKCQRKTGEH
jgi:hypothetical protein